MAAFSPFDNDLLALRPDQSEKSCGFAIEIEGRGPLVAKRVRQRRSAASKQIYCQRSACGIYYMIKE